MAEVDQPYPAVLGLGDIDAVPAVVFIHGTGCVVAAFQGQVLYAALLDESVVLIDHGLGAAPAVVDVAGDGGVERHLVAVNGQNGAIPSQVDVAGVPRPIAHALAAAKGGAAQGVNPFLGGRAADGEAHALLEGG